MNDFLAFQNVFLDRDKNALGCIPIYVDRFIYIYTYIFESALWERTVSLLSFWFVLFLLVWLSSWFAPYISIPFAFYFACSSCQHIFLLFPYVYMFVFSFQPTHGHKMLCSTNSAQKSSQFNGKPELLAPNASYVCAQKAEEEEEEEWRNYVVCARISACFVMLDMLPYHNIHSSRNEKHKH